MRKKELKKLSRKELYFYIDTQSQIIKRQRGELNVLRYGVPQGHVQSNAKHRTSGTATGLQNSEGCNNGY